MAVGPLVAALAGMPTTFPVATIVIVRALGIAAGSRALATHPSRPHDAILAPQPKR